MTLTITQSEKDKITNQLKDLYAQKENIKVIPPNYLEIHGHDTPECFDSTQLNLISNEIGILETFLKDVTVGEAEEETKERISTIGDILKVKFVFAEDDVDTVDLRLVVSPKGNNDCSVISDAGRAILGKPVGYKGQYRINGTNNVVNFEILEFID